MPQNDIEVKFGGDSRGLDKTLRKVTKKSNGVASKIAGGFKNAFSATGLLVGGGIAGVLSMLAKKAVETAAKFEQTKVAYDTMLGSTEKATRLLDQLTQFSTVTPFEPEQVYQAGKQLLAFGVTAEEMIPTLKTIGDIAAGTGKDFNELAGIFGKIKTKGKAQAEELNMMAEAGIPIIQTLAEMYQTTAANVYKMGSEGKIAFSDIEAAFASMSGEGGRFNGMMEKQSQTLNGIMSTLKGNIAEVGKGLAESFLPALKDASSYANDVAKAFMDINRARKTISKGGATGRYTETGYGIARTISAGAVGLFGGSAEGMEGMADRQVLDMAPTVEEQSALLKRRREIRNRKKAGLAPQTLLERNAEAKAAADAKKAEFDKVAAESIGADKVTETIAALRQQAELEGMRRNGLEKEAKIKEKILDLEKKIGRALTEEEKAALTEATAGLFDSKLKGKTKSGLQLDGGGISFESAGKSNSNMSDSLLRIGGLIGETAGRGVVDNLDKDRNNLLKRIAEGVDNFDTEPEVLV